MRNRKQTRASFNADAQKYDERIIKHVPGYLDMQEAILNLIPFDPQDKFDILDLGVGTGSLAKKILDKFPNASLVGIDFSEQMLAMSRARLAPFGKRAKLVNASFDKDLPSSKFDVVTAVLSLHHMENDIKKKLIGKLYKRIRKPGALLIGDLIRSKWNRISDIYMNLWKDNLRTYGFSEEYIQKCYHKKKYETEDILTTLENHLLWLKKSGFDETEVFWKKYHIAVFGGFKGQKKNKNFSFPPLFEKKSKNPNYILWESITLALFENFKFNYETLGTIPPPELKNDIHPYFFLKELKSYNPREYYFGEHNHVHFNSFIGYGNKLTGYPMDKGIAGHHFTFEIYQMVWGSFLYNISNWPETFPLLFSTKNNYFMESCNSFFLKSDDYLNEQSYPIITSSHKNVFTKIFFRETNWPTSLLTKNFSIQSKTIPVPKESIKTLNFCLKIFQEACLIQYALMELFGKNNDKQKQIEYLLKNWNYPNGNKAKGISLYRLNMLSFVYLSLHPAATALCYGLYRTKYGTKQTTRSAFYVKHNNKIIALKDFLRDQTQTYIDSLNNYLLNNRISNKNLLSEVQDKIIAALDLARMFGIGYKTNKEQKVNVHENIPRNFSPPTIADPLRKINFIVEHSKNSPLWRIFYDYCSEWWNREEINQIINGKGPHWKRLKNKPRTVAVHVFHKLAAYFWKEYLKKLDFPEKINNFIIEKYKNILGD